MKKIAPDKWKHFYVGIAMGVIFQAFLTWLIPDHFYLATTIAFVIVVAISYGFEVFSKVSGFGHYEVMDAIAAIIGGILGMAATITVAAIW